MKFTINGDYVSMSPKTYKKKEERVTEGKVIVVKIRGKVVEYKITGTDITKLTSNEVEHEATILSKIQQYHVPSKPLNQIKISYMT